MRPSVGRSAQCPVDRLHFFFSFELPYLESAQEASFGRRSELGTQLAQKLLRSPVSLCRMVLRGLERPRRATASDRAEIGRLSPPHVNWKKNALLVELCLRIPLSPLLGGRPRFAAYRAGAGGITRRCPPASPQISSEIFLPHWPLMPQFRRHTPTPTPASPMARPAPEIWLYHF
jgi:hypothetical protein